MLSSNSRVTLGWNSWFQEWNYNCWSCFTGFGLALQLLMFIQMWTYTHAIFVIDPWEQPSNSDCWEFSSVAQSCPTLCNPVNCSINSQSLLKLMSIELVMPSSHLILCCPLLLPLSIFPSIRVFFNESVLHIKWPKYWTFSFNINPSNEHLGLISFRMDWLDLLVLQGTLKSLLQHHSSKASILWCSAFFIVQLSHPYMTTRLDGPLLAK